MSVAHTPSEGVRGARQSRGRAEASELTWMACLVGDSALIAETDPDLEATFDFEAARADPGRWPLLCPIASGRPNTR